MFNEILRRIVDETEGAIGAVLMGYDGIAIDQYFLPVESLDLQIVAIEYSPVLKEIRNTAEILQLGEMEEVSIKTDHHIIVIRMMTSEYFVALALGQDGNFGKGRYVLSREKINLIEAMA